jgi:hypothetical protein
MHAMAKRSKPKFVFPPLSESAKKVKKLLEPRRRPGTESDDVLAAWAADTIICEELRRLLIIAKAYNVELMSADRDSIIRFAYMMARDHISGFSVLSPKRGTTANSMRNNEELVREVDSEIERLSKAGKIKQNVGLPSEVIRSVQRRGKPGHGRTESQIWNAYNRTCERREAEEAAILAALQQCCEDSEQANSAQRLSRLGEGMLAPKAEEPRE